MSELLLTLSANSSIVIATIFTLNYFILPNYNTGLPDILLVSIVLGLISLLQGFLTSLFVAKYNCDNYNPRNAIKQGFLQVLYALIGYFMVYFIDFVRSPFLSIFGDKELGYSIAQSFIIVLNIVIAIIINYYSTIKESCKIDPSILEKKLKKLDKFLDEEPVKEEETFIEVKD